MAPSTPAPPRHSPSLARGAAQAGVARFLALAAPLATVPVATRVLGPEGYGVFVLASVVYALVPILDLGLGLALVTSLAPALERDDTEGAQRIISTVHAALVRITLVLAVPLVLLAVVLPWGSWFGVAGHLDGVLAGSLVITVVCVLVSFPYAVGLRARYALQEIGPFMMWSAAASLATPVVAIPLLLVVPDVRVLVLASFGTSTLVFVLAYVWWVRHAPAYRPRRAMVDWLLLPPILRLGLAMAAGNLLQALSVQADRLIVQRMLTTADVGVYGVTQRVASVPQQVISFMTAPLWPAAGSAIARGDRAWLQRVFLQAQALCLGAGVLTMVVFALLGPFVIALFAGEDFRPSRLLVLCMGAAVAGQIFVAPVGMLFHAFGLKSAAVLMPLSELAVLIVVALVAVPAMGAAGAALGVAVGFWLTGLVSIPWLVLHMRRVGR